MRPFTTAVLLLTLAGCSENFGTPPIAGTRVPTRAQAAVGPVVSRVPVGMSGGGETVVLGTDRSIFRVRVDGDQARWTSEHPGFVTDEGAASPQFVQTLASDAGTGLYLHDTAVGGGQGDHFLFASSDGGVRYGALGRPDPLERRIHHIAVVGPGELFARGAYLAVQDVQIWAREVDGQTWSSASTPNTAANIDAIASIGGDIVVGVQVASGGELWKSRDDALELEAVATADRGPWIAVGFAADGTPAGVTATAVVVGEDVFQLPIGWGAKQARFASGGKLVILGADAISDGVFFVQSGQDVGSALRLPEPAADFAPVYDGTTTWLIAEDFGLLRHDARGFRRFEFEGRDSWWTAIVADTREPGQVAMATRNSGAVYRGSARGGWVNTGELANPNSTPQMLAVDRRTATGLWLGSFGLYFQEEGQDWAARTTGMSSYLQDQALDLLAMSTLAVDPEDPTHIWSGAAEGNGPYESFNGGLSWTPRHDGLGVPGSVFGEDGLPDATQVRRFVFDGGHTWMATFRGGVWELQPDSSWGQVNEGLPDFDGTPVDSCCYETLVHEVDVRDLLVLDDASLLAATGWGIYLDEGANDRWTNSSVGLSNSNIVSLAQHPDRADWILAAARGDNQLADWLFLSTDAGRQWRPVDTGRPYAPVLDAVWSDPSRLQVVAILDGMGAWTMELMP